MACVECTAGLLEGKAIFLDQFFAYEFPFNSENSLTNLLIRRRERSVAEFVKRMLNRTN